jgi:formylglycine-generating enzyme required for sulfatase activity
MKTELLIFLLVVTFSALAATETSGIPEPIASVPPAPAWERILVHLSGEAGAMANGHRNRTLVPVPPENLTITVFNANDILLAWDPVTQSTTGEALIPDGYEIYYSSDPNEPWDSFTYMDNTSDTSYIHAGVASSYGHMFYFVIAYINTPAIPENFILVEGGTFSNGTSSVTVSSFYLDKYELTQAAYQAVMGVNPSYFTGVTDGPVERVSWFKAIEYCNRRSMLENLDPCYIYSTYGTNPDAWPAGWFSSYSNHVNLSCNWTASGYRLPTEMEWMFAARGGNLSQGYIYSGSDIIGNVAWYNNNSGTTTHTVGTKAPNELGIYDMSGNVFEWVWDIYALYPSEPQTDPHGPADGSTRIQRGGSFFNNASACLVSFRMGMAATDTDLDLGFRVLRKVP